MNAVKDTKGIYIYIYLLFLFSKLAGTQTLLENLFRLLGPFSCRKSKQVIPKKCSFVHHNTQI